jgi:hypothetical protein
MLQPKLEPEAARIQVEAGERVERRCIGRHGAHVADDRARI